MIVLIIVMCGFLYGSDYFRFNEKYGNSSVPLGVYILSLKWWNIKINWYTYLDEWKFDLSVKFMVSIRYKKYVEYHVIFSNTGFRICVLNIN